MAVKRKRAGAWQYVVKRAGVLQKPLYLSFKSEAEGDDYVRRLEAMLDRGIVPPELVIAGKSQATVREAVRKYLGATTVSTMDKSQLDVFLTSVPAEMLCSQIDFKWTLDWVEQLKREDNLAPSTIRHRVGALARAVGWMLAHGGFGVTSNPLRALPRGYAVYTDADAKSAEAVGGKRKIDHERDRRLSQVEEKNIRQVFDTGKPVGDGRRLALKNRADLLLLFEMALESAMRLREMFTLTAGQVDLGKRTIFLEKTKNGYKRQVPISSVLLDLLRPRLRGLKASDRLFPWWTGDASKQELKRVTALISRQYARIFNAAGCPDLVFHDLRHEATSRLFERTKLSDVQIAKITGHKSMSMLMRYANLRGSDLVS